MISERKKDFGNCRTILGCLEGEGRGKHCVIELLDLFSKLYIVIEEISLISISYRDQQWPTISELIQSNKVRFFVICRLCISSNSW